MSDLFRTRGFLPAVVISASLMFLPAARAQSSIAPSMAGEESVELQFTLQPESEGGVIARYVVDLRNSASQSVRIIQMASGETVHFKHLKPDIYKACIQEEDRHNACTSIDLFPPQANKHYKASLKIAAPQTMPDSVGRYTIKLEQLKVPDKAKQELDHSLQAVVRGYAQEELAHLRRAIEIAPNFMEALNNLGVYYHLQGDEESAIPYFARVTELEPEIPIGWSNLSGALVASGKYEEAIKASLRGLAISPDSTSLNSQAGLCNYRLHRYSEAEKYFTKALQLDPASADFPMLNLARIALIEHRTEDAEAYINLFRKLHPNYPQSGSSAETVRGATLNHPPTKGMMSGFKPH
jgi:tetratricopeptide (TPR) repeat protein